MRTPMLDEAPSRPSSPVRVRRHRRPTIVVATGALTLLAVTAGAAVALVNRPAPATPARPAAVAGPAATPTTAAPVVRTPPPVAPVANPPDQNAPGTPVSHRAPEPGPVLADGTYPAFIRGIDASRRTMVVDVIQVFEGDAAMTAQIEDGLTRNNPGYEIRDLYIRNQNPLLRTLPIARDASIKLLGTCESPAPPAVLKVLARNAATNGYYYSLTVSEGSVHRIVEHQRQPAC
jgi:hypothetical protein